MPEEIDILLTSVPHSGTRFFRKIIKPSETWHVYDKRVLERGGLEIAKIVACALRRPEDIWQSWWWRREGLNHTGIEPGTKWFAAWECLRRAFEERHDIHVLPIDLPSRGIHLEAFAQTIGRPLETDWSPVGEFHGKGDPEAGWSEPPEIDFDPIYEIPIIREYYG